jgi:hypothetical protein
MLTLLAIFGPDYGTVAGTDINPASLAESHAEDAYSMLCFQLYFHDFRARQLVLGDRTGLSFGYRTGRSRICWSWGRYGILVSVSAPVFLPGIGSSVFLAVIGPMLGESQTWYRYQADYCCCS